MWKQIIKKSFDSNNKLFAMAICQNNKQYVKTNYHLITDQKIQNECWLLAASTAKNPDILKILKELFNLNIDYVNEDFENCLIMTCKKKNPSIEVIKYLIEELAINHDQKDKIGNNCLMIACQNNSSITIIKYLIETIKMNPNNCSIHGENCLLIAAKNNSDKIIRYLIEKQKINIDSEDSYSHNCLMTACFASKCLGIIRYLVHERNMNIHSTDKYGYNCFLMACGADPPNLRIVKYLVQELHVDVNHKTNEFLGWSDLIIRDETGDTDIDIFLNQLTE